MAARITTVATDGRVSVATAAVANPGIGGSWPLLAETSEASPGAQPHRS
jgi:hypothetical protein